MAHVLAVSGSPMEVSRSAVLLGHVCRLLTERGHTVDRLAVRDLPAAALLHADFSDPAVIGSIARLERADGLVVATPVYKAAYSGVIKVFLDLLPQDALRHKTVLPIATGGSPNHMLALDYALRPVLQSLAARHILPGVYANDSQVTLLPEGAHHIGLEISERLDEAVATLFAEGLRPPATAGFEPIAFSRVRCSV